MNLKQILTKIKERAFNFGEIVDIIHYLPKNLDTYVSFIYDSTKSFEKVVQNDLSKNFLDYKIDKTVKFKFPDSEVETIYIQDELQNSGDTFTYIAMYFPKKNRIYIMVYVKENSKQYWKSEELAYVDSNWKTIYISSSATE